MQNSTKNNEDVMPTMMMMPDVVVLSFHIPEIPPCTLGVSGYRLKQPRLIAGLKRVKIPNRHVLASGTNSRNDSGKFRA